MPISISHLGETIVAEMAERKRWETIEALNLTEVADPVHVRSVSRFAYNECKLAKHSGYIFDGASKVDVVLWVSPGLAVALELKLGGTRLSKTRIDGEFLSKCRISRHKKTVRIAGNMMAILDRRFDGIAPEDGLSVEISDQKVQLERRWILVTRQSVLTKWDGDDRPDFSANTSCVTIEELVKAFGGKDEFNSLVGGLLKIDYFETWVSSG